MEKYPPSQWPAQQESNQPPMATISTPPPRQSDVPRSPDINTVLQTLDKPLEQRVWDSFKAVWRVLTINKKVSTGSAIVAFFFLVAIFGPLLLGSDPDVITHNFNLHPSAIHWLGTTNLGQDIFGQLVVGTQTSVLWGFVSGIIVTLLSVVIGLVSGYFGGFIDELLSLITNIFLVLPGLPLMIVLAAYVPPGPLTISLVVALTSWAWGARVLRAQTLSLRAREFVTAARSNGESTWRIIFYELFPNQTSLVAANFVSTMIQVILAQAALEFLGLGDISKASWGTLLYWASSSGALLGGQWWWFVPPGLCIAVLGAGLALINFGIDEVADPRLRSEPKINVSKTKKAVA